MWRISCFNVFEFCHAEKWDSRGDLEAKKFFFFLNIGDVIILMMSKYTSETKDTREKRITGATRE